MDIIISCEVVLFVILDFVAFGLLYRVFDYCIKTTSLDPSTELAKTNNSLAKCQQLGQKLKFLFHIYRVCIEDALT